MNNNKIVKIARAVASKNAAYNRASLNSKSDRGARGYAKNISKRTRGSAMATLAQAMRYIPEDQLPSEAARVYRDAMHAPAGSKRHKKAVNNPLYKKIVRQPREFLSHMYHNNKQFKTLWDNKPMRRHFAQSASQNPNISRNIQLAAGKHFQTLNNDSDINTIAKLPKGYVNQVYNRYVTQPTEREVSEMGVSRGLQQDADTRAPWTKFVEGDSGVMDLISNAFKGAIGSPSSQV